MTIKTLYPSTVTQSSQEGTSFREFANLGNVKNSKDTYAKSKDTNGGIASKAGTHKRPSTITAKNFKANIPGSARIDKVTVEYAADYDGNISIGKSTINILNISGEDKNGKALTKTMTKSSATWTGHRIVGHINSADFGVTISFPANTNADTGYVKVKYIRIIIEYTEANYSITANKISGEYTGDNFKFNVNASNVNATPGDTSVTINLPPGVSYVDKDSGDGSIYVSGSTLTWVPGLSMKVLNRSVVLNLNISTDGDHVISLVESQSGHSTSYNIYTYQPAHYETPEIPMNNLEFPTNDHEQTNTVDIGDSTDVVPNEFVKMHEDTATVFLGLEGYGEGAGTIDWDFEIHDLNGDDITNYYDIDYGIIEDENDENYGKFAITISKNSENYSYPQRFKLDIHYVNTFFVYY